MAPLYLNLMPRMTVAELRGVAKTRGVPRAAKLKKAELCEALIEHADRGYGGAGWFYVTVPVGGGLDERLRERAYIAPDDAGHWICRETVIFAPSGLIITDKDSIHSAAVGHSIEVSFSFVSFSAATGTVVKRECDRDELWAFRGRPVDACTWMREFGSAKGYWNYVRLEASAKSIGFDGMPAWSSPSTAESHPDGSTSTSATAD